MITAFIQSSIPLGVPLLFGSVGEIVTEKSGHLNLGIPGIMYAGGIGGVIGAFLYERACGNQLENMNPALAILIPLLVSAFRRAEELALAMECRCYHGGEGRTRMKQLKTTTTDYMAVVYTVVFMSMIILVNIYL